MSNDPVWAIELCLVRDAGGPEEETVSRGLVWSTLREDGARYAFDSAWQEINVPDLIPGREVAE